MNAGATSVIGNVIGEEDSHMSKVLAIVNCTEGCIIYTILSLLTYIYSREIAEMYSGDSEDTAVTLDYVI